ncbi:protein Red [Nephila pilipes]|uniref:Protein Red n=1 Tax=Nephila pilipes TaxID=299642 RepID=A0A8X6QM51_NEPPI|nr:protein Red [Nephila pilipes]
MVLRKGQRNRYRAEGRRDGVNPDHQNEDPITSTTGDRAVARNPKSGLDTVERRRQMIQESKFFGGDMEHTHLVKGFGYTLLQKVRETLAGAHKEDDSRLKAKLTSKLERDMPESYAECYTGAPEEHSEYRSVESHPVATAIVRDDKQDARGRERKWFRH